MLLYSKKFDDTLPLLLFFTLYNLLLKFLFQKRYTRIQRDYMKQKDFKEFTGIDYLKLHASMQHNVNLILRDTPINILSEVLDVKYGAKPYMQRKGDLFFNILTNSNFEIGPKLKENKVKIFAVTYNIAGNSPDTATIKLQPFFEKIKTSDCDLLFIGIQELMELKIKIKNLKGMINSVVLAKRWEYLFNKELADFVLISKETCIWPPNLHLYQKKCRTKSDFVKR